MADSPTLWDALAGGASLAAVANTLWGWLRSGRRRAAEEAKATAAATASAARTEEAIKAMREQIVTTEASIARAEVALADHKLEVARRYVSIDMLAATESRLLNAIKEVGQSVRGLVDRVDRVVDRSESTRA